MRALKITAAALAVVALAATPALAQRNRGGGQSTTVIVVNSARVLTETALGRDMAQKLATIRQQIGAEIQALAPEQQAIEAEQASLQQATRSMTAEQIRNNASISSRIQALQTRAQAFQTRQQSLQGDFECSRALAVRDFERQVTPIVRQLMEQRGAGVVLDAAQVQVVADGFDITPTVIQQVDATSRTANVARHAVSECQAQQTPTQAPAQ
ncbi:OmpH family outer membrane protein [Terricaulis sp.]|uniref:OmpH family outer membrane protein n=1 Tax=Terricaulis sp. TaxID=2768686 RepID=UPI0037843CFE